MDRSCVQGRGEAHDEQEGVEELRVPEVLPGVQEQKDPGHSSANCLRKGAEVPVPLLRAQE